MAYATINNTSLWYEVAGQGPHLLQLHGLGLGHANFAPVTPLLRPDFTVIDYDMRGFGDSDKPPAPYSIEGWADEAIGLLDHLGLDAVDVHGTSFGGMVGIVMAAKYPDRVKRLVIGCCMARYDSLAILNKKVWKAMATATGMGEEVANLIASQAFSRAFHDTDRAPAQVAAMGAAFKKNDPELWKHFCDLLCEADLTGYLPQITAPVLVTSGDQDIMTPVDSGPAGVGTREMVRLLPNAWLTLLEGCGHLHLVERPEESAKLVRDFILDGTVNGETVLGETDGR
ncbi:alpha/beta fold hydrolase [Micromonospora sp. NPDC001898]|uniref:alpha/beta fold hydrolase n=1 Tax=Micromonospora sp. NPDC001898 TaxID=3364221 RepID=UPI0036B10C94